MAQPTPAQIFEAFLAASDPPPRDAFERLLLQHPRQARELRRLWRAHAQKLDALRSRAEEVYAAAQPVSGFVDLERLCDAHPELADELRHIEEDRRLIGALEGDFHLAEESFPFFGRQEQQIPNPSTGVSEGQVLGDYRLLRPIGQGGMGQVWEAEQLSLRKRVALKLVRPDRVTRRTLDLFAREARAGGRLSHPGLVDVYAHGEDEGIAWIAMEFVEGSWTLRDFLDDVAKKEELPSSYYRDVALFVANVAEAVHAAHCAGVIHRDLKPQNVLIGPDDRPRLTDFGLARIEGEDLDLSQSGQVLGTYHYMSPEQVHASRSGIDQRTDVWSLGVVLYELLALQRPFEGDSGHQIAARILHADPPDLRKLRSRVPVDLAVVAGKALEKKASARYASAAALAADLRAHVEHRPIAARQPSTTQRAAKWVRRNPTVSAAGAVGAVALIAICLLLLRYVDKNAELETERDRLEKVVALQEGFFENLDVAAFGVSLRVGAQDELAATIRSRGGTEAEVESGLALFEEARAPINYTDLGRQAIRQEILLPAKERIDEEFGDDPLTRARLEASLASTLENMGLYEEALPLREAVLASRYGALGALHPDTLASTSDLGWVLTAMGQFDEALSFYREAWAGAREGLGDEHPQVALAAHNIAFVLSSMGEEDEALTQYREALAGLRRSRGDDHPETLSCLDSMATLLMGLGDFEAAMPLCREALEGRQETLGGDHPSTLTSLSNMGALLESMGRPEEALPYIRAALDGNRRALGDEHPDTLTSVGNMGYMLLALGDFEGAVPYYEEALEGSLEVLGRDHPDTLSSMGNMGSLHLAAGRYEAAMPYYEDALEGSRRVFGDDDAMTLSMVSNMSFLLDCMEEYESAMEYCEEALEGRRRVLPVGHPDTLTSLNNKASLLNSLGRSEESLPLLREALEGRLQAQGEDHPDTLVAMHNLGFSLRSHGEFEEAVVHLERLADLLAGRSGPDSEEALDALESLGRVLLEAGRAGEALPVLEDAHARAVEHLHPDHEVTGLLSERLRACYRALHEAKPDAGYDARAAELAGAKDGDETEEEAD